MSSHLEDQLLLCESHTTLSLTFALLIEMESRDSKRKATPTTPMNNKTSSSSRKDTPPEFRNAAKAWIEEKKLDALSNPVRWETLSDEGKQRVFRLLRSDVTWNHVDGVKPSLDATTFADAFSAFQDACPWWTIDDVFWVEDARYLVIRCQRSSNCYLHAVVTLVHYLIALATGSHEHEMIDVGR
jgi:hypothetical protein